jgi:multidrug resistance efflux pump
MQSQLFPPEVIENSSEAYLPKVRVRSQMVYWVTLLAVIATIGALPFVYVDVSTQGLGQIRTVLDKNEIRPLMAGTVAEVFVRENQIVRKNQPLLRLQTDIIDSKIRLNHYQQTEKQAYIRDLARLVTIDSLSLFGLRGLASSLYIQQYHQFHSVLKEQLEHQRKVKKELDTDRKLYQDKVISMREYDEKEYSYRRLLSEYRSTIEKQITQWQSELSAYRVAMTEFQAEEKQFVQEKSLYTIYAPVGGSLQQWNGKYTGSYIQAGESLGIISPGGDSSYTSLIAECYVSPKDIGLLKKQMVVQFQIDAFNYTEWGLITGKVSNIADDFVLINDKPVFKVLCQLDKQLLQLKNGYRGRLKKGMSFRARFLVTRRSLYQLLYDNTDNWLNPAR